MQPTTKREPVKDAVHNIADKAKDAAHNVADKAKDAAHTVADSARDVASQAGHGISNAASTVGKKAEQWTANAGHGVESFADTVREKGPSSGVLGDANKAVADGLEKAGEYLSDKNLSGMMGDVTNLIKRNPIPALLIGLGIGYILGKSLRS